MTRLLKIAAAALLLVLAGCSQPYGMHSKTTGMMGSDEDYGRRAMGPEMMHGENPRHGQGVYGGMHRDMMGGDGTAIPNLTNEQRTQIAEIQKEFHRKQWVLMGQMHEHGRQSGGVMPGSHPFDEQTARQTFDQMAAIRKQLFENSLEARKRINGLLTPQQREQWQGHSGGQ